MLTKPKEYDWAEADLARCKPPLQALWNRIKNEKIGVALWSTYRPDDYYPDHRDGDGGDFGVSRGPGLRGNKHLGNRLIKKLLKWHKMDLIHVRSIIFWRRRWTPSRGWHRYRGSFPHVCHVHVWLASDSPCISPTPGKNTTKHVAGGHDLPTYPLAQVHGHQAWYGPKTGPVWQRSGYYSATDRHHIRRIQARLRQQGYMRVVIDGLYGPKTRKAVTAYQKKHKLTPDGLVGPKTWKTLFKD